MCLSGEGVMPELRAVAAVKEDEAKALDMFNNGAPRER
jgi:hypothetical protein